MSWAGVDVLRGKCPGVYVMRVNVLGGKSPGGKCPRGKCPRGICPGGNCPGGKCVLSK